MIVKNISKLDKSHYRNNRILLIGIGGVYNYGCEAIVRGTAEIIRREYHDAEITYASYRPFDDQSRLRESGVRIIERTRSKFFPIRNVCRKLLSQIGIKWHPIMDSLSLLKNVDAVLSIGGDIYTLNPNSGYSMSLPRFGDYAIHNGIPYILWGASVGPFSAQPIAEKEYSKHLKSLSLITARESITIDYLSSLGICDNVIPCADPAFVVAPNIVARNESLSTPITIGVNLSPLSLRHAGQLETEALDVHARAIQGLIDDFQARILLIPHVVCAFKESDDDLRYLQKLQQAISPEYQQSVSVLESDLGFIGVKNELIKCDLVIAARMHCAINALAAHVPTIFISYSRKSEGMCRYVYGNKDWVLQLHEFAIESVLEKQVGAMINTNYELRAYLNKRIPEIQKEAHHPMQRLKEIFDDHH